MARVKILFPASAPIFSTKIPVGIRDINYGGHVGNDSLLGILHEARVRWLRASGYTELDVHGVSLIMADAMLVYKGEAFYGDLLNCDIHVVDVTRAGFDLLYRMDTTRDGVVEPVLECKTGMVCFNYHTRRVAAMPGPMRDWLMDE